jgi:hypothetical protein
LRTSIEVLFFVLAILLSCFLEQGFLGGLPLVSPGGCRCAIRSSTWTHTPALFAIHNFFRNLYLLVHKYVMKKWMGPITNYTCLLCAHSLIFVLLANILIRCLPTFHRAS